MVIYQKNLMKITIITPKLIEFIIEYRLINYKVKKLLRI